MGHKGILALSLSVWLPACGEIDSGQADRGEPDIVDDPPEFAALIVENNTPRDVDFRITVGQQIPIVTFLSAWSSYEWADVVMLPFGSSADVKLEGSAPYRESVAEGATVRTGDAFAVVCGENANACDFAFEWRRPR